ncbi:hypothetical protein [Treponema denticola]|uniref:hypothetical protein n=1 Tax=Treponema denticola TaxID=158 RepID=UPI0005D1463A|nr:hypothetical protein [Treponema denticola]
MYIFHLRVLDLRLKLSRLETPASVPVGECTSISAYECTFVFDFHLIENIVKTTGLSREEIENITIK